MNEKIEALMTSYLGKAFGELANEVLKVQKKEIGLDDNLAIDDYMRLVNQISEVCVTMFGKVYAQKIHQGLIEILEHEKGAGG